MSYLDSAYDELLKDANTDGLEGEHEMTVRQIEDGYWNDGSERREIFFAYTTNSSMRPLKKTFSRILSAGELKELKQTNERVFKSQMWQITLGRQMVEACGKTPFKDGNSKAIEIGDKVWARIRRGKPKGDRERGFLEIEKFIPAPDKAKASTKDDLKDEVPF